MPAQVAPPAEAEKKSGEAITTTFFVFTGSDDGKAWTFIGTRKARDRDHAVRLMFPDPTEGHEGPITAVSEAAWKPKRRVLEKKPTAKLQQMDMPTSAPLPLSTQAAPPEPPLDD